MKRASLAAAFAASLVFGSASAAVAIDGASVAAERLLGSADEQARYLALEPFTREIGAFGIVSDSLDASLARAGVPAAAMLGARQALATAIDLDRDVHAGDRFYVRYTQAFTRQGTPIGVGQVLWAELRTAAKGVVAIHRFRTLEKVERFWLVNGQEATPPAMRLPLDTIVISSGFGLRADPFDQPPPGSTGLVAALAKPSPMGGPKPKQLPPSLVPAALPPGLPTGGVNGNGSQPSAAAPFGVPPWFAWQTKLRYVSAASTRALFLHAGVDLVAPFGTPVHAAADGVVEGAAPNGGYGNWIRVDHAGHLATVYGHLSAFAPGIAPGTAVAQGEVIGFVGSTGRSTGAHLHFELLTNGKPVNPMNNPEFKVVTLRSPDLERFRKQVAQSLEERDREMKVLSAGF
jgi:murein DD-endopeptidase MepM/ murein hydrolase activator NlpD